MQGLIINGTCENIGNTDSKLLYFGVLENGKNFIWEQEKPYLLLFTAEKKQAIRNTTKKIINKKFKTLDNKPLDLLYFNTEKDLKNACEVIDKDKQYEADIEPSMRYLMEKNIKGSINFESLPTEKKENDFIFKNPKINHCKNSIELNLLSIDIETGNNNKDLYCISLYSKNVEKVLIIWGKASKKKGYIQYYPNEKELLKAFIEEIHIINPQVFIGWNVVNFDFDFLIKKYQQYHLDFCIGVERRNIESFRPKNKKGLIIRIPGRFILDGIQMLKWLNIKLPDYRLDSAASVLLGEKKLIEATGKKKIKQIESLFLNQKEVLAEYNLKDSKLVCQIFEKEKILLYKLTHYLLSGVYIERALNTNYVFDNLYLPKLHQKRFVAPNEKKTSPVNTDFSEDIIESKHGAFGKVCVIHFKDFFPSIVQTFKIDPLGKMQAIQDPTQSISSPRGIKFHTTKHILPSLIEDYLNKAKSSNKEQNDLMKKASTSILFSLISTLNNPRSRFALSGLFDSINKNATYFTLESVKKIESWGWEILYADTEGMIISASNKTEFLSKIQQLCKRLNHYWEKTLKKKYKAHSYLKVEIKNIYEKIFLFEQKSISFDKLKPQYIAVKEVAKEWVEKGIESIKKDFVSIAIKLQKKIINALFENQDPSEIIRELKKSLLAGQEDSLLIFKKRFKKSTKTYEKSLPLHLQAAQKIKGEKPFYIQYFMTKEGPEPIANQSNSIDYKYYLEKQIKPILESTLSSTSYQDLIEEITDTKSQLNFFAIK